jgi:hypothetical protein
MGTRNIAHKNGRKSGLDQIYEKSSGVPTSNSLTGSCHSYFNSLKMQYNDWTSQPLLFNSLPTAPNFLNALHSANDSAKKSLPSHQPLYIQNTESKKSSLGKSCIKVLSLISRIRSSFKRCRNSQIYIFK